MWFLYTKWSDIETFTFGDSSYLLQGKKNRITRASYFRITEMECVKQVSKSELAAAKLWEQW